MLGLCGNGWPAGRDYRVLSDHAPLVAVLKTFAEGRLLGASYGRQPPWVLALHGWERSHRDFDDVCRDLDAVSLDLPGFGAAPPPGGAWSTARYAEHVAAVLDDMAPRVVVVGHSFGGRVAVHLAAAHPERIAAQVLTGVPLIQRAGGAARSAPLRLRAAKALRRAGVGGEARIERLRQQYG
jgi:pimeloyl-ACP methyl ester carboxylesterase